MNLLVQFDFSRLHGVFTDLQCLNEYDGLEKNSVSFLHNFGMQ